jgi:hypothetical protein
MFVWTISDVIGLVALTIALACYAGHLVYTWIKQKSCPHLVYNETMACDAICRMCGKNLGFIGNVRERAKNDRTE